MTRHSLRNVSFSPIANRARSRWSIATIAALVLGAGVFISVTPAAAAERGNYCLSSTEIMDCGFTSLAQCQATASGGLGECSMVAPRPYLRGRYAR